MHTEKRPGVPGLRNERDHLEGYLADGSPGATTSRRRTQANAMNEIIPAKQNRVNKKHAGGMPKFEPTDEQRKTVERAAEFGLPQDKTCQLVVSDRTGRPIDDDTLRHFVPSWIAAWP